MHHPKHGKAQRSYHHGLRPQKATNYQQKGSLSISQVSALPIHSQYKGRYGGILQQYLKKNSFFQYAIDGKLDDRVFQFLAGTRPMVSTGGVRRYVSGR